MAVYAFLKNLAGSTWIKQWGEWSASYTVLCEWVMHSAWKSFGLHYADWSVGQLDDFFFIASKPALISHPALVNASVIQ